MDEDELIKDDEYIDLLVEAVEIQDGEESSDDEELQLLNELGF